MARTLSGLDSVAKNHQKAVDRINELVNASGHKSLDSIILECLSIPEVLASGQSVWAWRRHISEAIRSYINHGE